MGALSLRLPESLHKKLSEVAARDGVSINQCSVRPWLRNVGIARRDSSPADAPFTGTLSLLPKSDAAPPRL